MSTQLRMLIDESRRTLEREYEGLGHEEAARRRFVNMAQSGDLALLKDLIDDLVRRHQSVLFGESMDPKVHLFRGAVIGLRELWLVISEVVEGEELDEERRLVEENAFVTLPEDSD